jgi:uncharacterized membrane protein
MGFWSRYNDLASVIFIVFGIMLLVVGGFGIGWPEILHEDVARGASVFGVGFVLIAEGLRWNKTVKEAGK